METTSEVPSQNPFTKIFLFGIVALLIWVGYIFLRPATSLPSASTIILSEPLPLTPAQVRILEVVSGHAYENHGSEVNNAVRCLNKNGSTMSFRTTFTDKKGNRIPTNVWLCLEKGEWFAVVTTTFEKIAGNNVARLVTAYRIATDIFPTIDDFINYIGLKWNARVIEYAIEAGNVMLQPK